ncbi:MAG: ribose 5-phosphate isomerase B [Tissierellia bacterium]|nr:ribose 5-phosphate isomerase B [Tissierellia bacterium]
MKIIIGSDHAGFKLKEEVKEFLMSKGHEVEDVGAYSEESVDYPEYGSKVARGILSKEFDKGIAICGSGIGISIAANRHKGIRCALCNEPLSAKLTRLHNDANVLAMGGRMIGTEMAKEIVDVFLNTEFEGGRHVRRVCMLDD